MLKYNTTIMLTPNGHWLKPPEKPVDPYNPLGLPPNTIRVRTNDGNAPIKVSESSSTSYTSYETATLVPGTNDVYDVYKSGTDLDLLLYKSTNVIEVLGANTKGITSMGTMFDMCTALTSIPLFDTSSVINMGSMFYDCRALTSVPLFDTSSVTNMHDMFHQCHTLTTVPLFNTSKVSRMDGMFESCITLTSVPLFDTSKVNRMDDMFNGCWSLTTVPLFDTSGVYLMAGMFAYCDALTTVPLFDTSKVTSMQSMFYSCDSLTTVPLFDTSNLRVMRDAFKNCINVQSGALALYQYASTHHDPIFDHAEVFKNCGSNTVTGAAELAQIPSDWK